MPLFSVGLNCQSESRPCLVWPGVPWEQQYENCRVGCILGPVTLAHARASLFLASVPREMEAEAEARGVEQRLGQE